MFDLGKMHNLLLPFVSHVVSPVFLLLIINTKKSNNSLIVDIKLDYFCKNVFSRLDFVQWSSALKQATKPNCKLFLI